MAKRSKHLGLADKAKKQKTLEQDKKPSNELTVELTEEADANDEIAQLKALWSTFSKSEKENELVLNGIIHECDRLLRNSDSLPDIFHAIYGLALAELASFRAAAEEDSEKLIKECFDAAIERLDLGLDKYPDSAHIQFAKSRVLINRIPLQYISRIEDDGSNASEFPAIHELLDKALSIYEQAEAKADDDYFNEENLEVLEAFDDLLDMVDNFGENDPENDEDEDEVEDGASELSKDHPLYTIKNSDKYNQWWRDHTVVYLDKVNSRKDKSATVELKRVLNKRLGQSYLQEAEIPSSVYTALTYDEGLEDVKELHGLSKQEAQKIAKELFQTAIEYLESAKDEEDPETWVPVAEAKISLGNMYDLESEEQEKLYNEAEKLLIRANKATNGKFKDVLDNLQNIDTLE